MPGERVERRLAAVLAADVAGYSRLMGLDEERTLTQLKTFRKTVVDPGIATHRGRIVKTTGDGMLVEFASAVDAARCAVKIQREMAQQNTGVPPELRIEFRIGIHVGDIPDWQLAEEAHCVERSFRFRNFREALTFLPNIRELARV